MITVLCTPAGAYADALLHLGPAGPYHFVSNASDPVLRIHFTERELSSPFALREAGAGNEVPQILLTTCLAEVFAQYAALSVPAYLRTIALAGLVRARALQRNHDLRQDDLRHGCHSRCILSSRLFLEEYLPVFEAPILCRSCRVFYGQLLPPEELSPLELQLDHLVTARAALRST